MIEESRIYAIVAGTVQVPVSVIQHPNGAVADLRKGVKTVVQPIGRQVAQVAHVVSRLRIEGKHYGNGLTDDPTFYPITTIVLQARDSAELKHVFDLAFFKKLNPYGFLDTNEFAYGLNVQVQTAVAFVAAPKKTHLVCDYLPLWGSDENRR